jgi:hypothetical protein
MSNSHEKRFRQGLLWAACFGGLMGFISLASGLSRPSIAEMRTVDLIHLLATGGCLGACLLALGLYIGILRRSKTTGAESNTSTDRQGP